jgi:hypothetical protein
MDIMSIFSNQLVQIVAIVLAGFLVYFATKSKPKQTPTHMHDTREIVERHFQSDYVQPRLNEADRRLEEATKARQNAHNRVTIPDQ